MTLPQFSQSPTDPDFVQDPYPFYDRARAAGPLFFWDDYGIACAAGFALVDGLLRDRRFGRECPRDLAQPRPEHLAPFYALEDHSMLELEPPRHTRLRQQVLRSFTARKVAGFGPGIAALADDLIATFPDRPFDLLTAYAEPIPVIIIARLLGVRDEMAGQLLAWSHDLVAMYQARRDRAIEDRAVAAAMAFSAFIADLIAARRERPEDDLISELVHRDPEIRLSDAEITSTAILLLNAGHEATVHALGNGVAAVLMAGIDPGPLIASDAAIARLSAEILRFDPPLHMFTRYALEEVEIAGHRFRRGEEVGLLLAAANRDPARFARPEMFDPQRPVAAHASFGAGIHFCVGAPLARRELEIALPALFRACPDLRLDGQPVFADRYHFHGLEALMVRCG